MLISALVEVVVPVPVILVLLAALVSDIEQPATADVGAVGEILTLGEITPANVGTIVPVNVTLTD